MTGTADPVPVRDIIMPLTSLTLAAIQAEAFRRHCRHAERSVLSKDMPNGQRLAILVEEVGDVARALTRNDDTTGLEVGLIHVAASPPPGWRHSAHDDSSGCLSHPQAR